LKDQREPGISAAPNTWNIVHKRVMLKREIGKF
jgi:hypothetical protein